jgi:N-acetylglucosamine malate deacetylase 1
MFFYGKRLLFVGAHPDDIELGCGAFIAHVLGSAELRCVTLSDNRKNPDLQNLMDEHYRSMSVLGVPDDAVVVRDFETRKFPHARQEILEYLIQQKREFRPDIAFVHTQADIHQDHQTVTEEALRAFRGLTVLGFDCLRSSYGFFPHFLVEVTESDVDRKLRALAEYRTYADRYYFDPNILRATLVRHGVLAERPYAEGFDILRIVGRFDGSCPEPPPIDHERP